MPDYIDTAEAAAIIGITPWGVRRYCRLGQLPALDKGRDYLILRKDAERFAKRPRRRGPKTKQSA